MNKKIDLKELGTLENKDLSTRLNYILKCLGKSKKDFYKDYEEIAIKKTKENSEYYLISERTFMSYFNTTNEKKNKRLPKKETRELMAEALEVEMWMLLPKADDFERMYKRIINFYSKALKVKTEFVYDYIVQAVDMDEIERSENEFVSKCFKSNIFNLQNRKIDDKMRKGILCILQYYLESEALHISNTIYDIIKCFFRLNEKGQEKIILYGRIIIEEFLDESIMEPIYDITQLCKKYDVNYNEPLSEQESHNNKKIGKINLTILKNSFDKKVKFDYRIIDFIYMLLFMTMLSFSHLNIILMCIFMDNKNNSIFPDDSLESYLLIAELFSRDEEFQIN